MKAEPVGINAREYVAELASRGQYCFTSDEAREALGVSTDAARLALNRLARRQLIASPARGFYVVIPPEYRSVGCLPADQFIPTLMERHGVPYYAALLSAAQYHGAAHHRPQEFQVMLARARRQIRCGQVRVVFVVRKHLEDVPVMAINTPRGTIQVSTPEATAVDLVGYPRHVGGLGQVATILSELGEQLDSARVVEAARTAPVTWAQRLGYILEVAGQDERAAELAEYVANTARDPVALVPGNPRGKARLDPTWKLYVNEDVEPEF